MSALPESPRFAESIESRLEFEVLISELSSGFIDVPPAEVDRTIEDALRRVCESLDIDLAVLWQWSDLAQGVIVPTHAYARQGIEAPESLNAEQFPWCYEQMTAGRVVALASLDELPAAAQVDRQSCRRFGVKSNLCLPLTAGGEGHLGALGLNAVRAERDWPDRVVQRLRLVAQIFTNALARARREQRLQATAMRLEAGAEIAGLGFYEIDLVDGVMYADDRFRDLLGMAGERQTGLKAAEFWVEHLHPDDRPTVLRLREQLHAGELPRIRAEYRFVHPAHGVRWIHHLAQVATRDAAGRAVKAYGVLRDVTEARDAADAVRNLGQRLIRAHEEERALLARELHDDVTQRLAVLAIEVGRAERVATDASQAEAMRSVHAGLVRLSEDVHSLAYQLHPSVLEELGLVEALRAECDRRARQCRFDLSVELEPISAAIGKEAALCLFRIAQEALNNVARHADAHAARVSLQQEEGGWVLAIRDDGVGFDPADRDRSHTLGLLGMQERVRLVNGTLDIESAPGSGTAIVAWVPAHGEAG
jgi:PAS domain S-box-containing protein